MFETNRTDVGHKFSTPQIKQANRKCPHVWNRLFSANLFKAGEVMVTADSND
jgi:hypothetical protein